MFCTKCGKESKEENNFCMFCGAPLKASVHTSAGNLTMVPANSANKGKTENSPKKSVVNKKKDKIGMIAIIATAVVFVIAIGLLVAKLIWNRMDVTNMGDGNDGAGVYEKESNWNSSEDTERAVYSYGENTQGAYVDDEDSAEYLENQGDIDESEDEEYICSYSTERKFTEDDIEQFLYGDYSEYDFPGDRSAVQMIINEMYARHGYIFQDEQLNAYFNQWEWYTDISNKKNDMNEIYREMSSIEQYNVDLLQSNR